MLPEDVVLAVLKHRDSWVVSDYLLRDGSPHDDTEEIARDIAARHELRYERIDNG